MNAAAVSDKVALITGATDGIGQAAALSLARQGLRVLIHGRSLEKAKAAAETIRRQTGNERVEIFLADYASLAQVRAMAAEIVQKHDRLDVLVNNAGVYLERRAVTNDGFEATYQINHLAPFLLTFLLRDVLVLSAPARIVNVTSRLHFDARLEWDNLQGERGYDGHQAYALSKLGNVVFTYELARRLKDLEVTANCLHPGGVATKLLHAGWRSGGIPPEQGADTAIWLATSAEVEGVTGQYFQNRRAAQSSPTSYDAQIQARFWQVSAEQLEIEPD